MPSIYLADADEAFRSEIARALRDRGARVVEFSNGSELGRRAQSEQPDLILFAGDREMEGCRLFARIKNARIGDTLPLVLVIDRSRPVEAIVTSVQSFLSEWGRLYVRNLAGVMGWLQARERSGRLELEAFGEPGTIVLRGGEVVEARWKELRGRKVLEFFIKDLPEVGFRFAERLDEVEGVLAAEASSARKGLPSRPEAGRTRFSSYATKEIASGAPVTALPVRIGQPRTRPPRDLEPIDGHSGPIESPGDGARRGRSRSVAQVHLDLARALLERRLTGEALLHLRIAEGDPELAGEVHYLLAVAHLQSGDFAVAVEELTACQRALPGDPRVAAALDRALAGLVRALPRPRPASEIRVEVAPPAAAALLGSPPAVDRVAPASERPPGAEGREGMDAAAGAEGSEAAVGGDGFGMAAESEGLEPAALGEGLDLTAEGDVFERAAREEALEPVSAEEPRRAPAGETAIGATARRDATRQPAQADRAVSRRSSIGRAVALQAVSYRHLPNPSRRDARLAGEGIDTTAERPLALRHEDPAGIEPEPVTESGFRSRGHEASLEGTVPVESRVLARLKAGSRSVAADTPPVSIARPPADRGGRRGTSESAGDRRWLAAAAVAFLWLAATLALLHDAPAGAPAPANGSSVGAGGSETQVSVISPAQRLSGRSGSSPSPEGPAASVAPPLAAADRRSEGLVALTVPVTPKPPASGGPATPTPDGATPTGGGATTPIGEGATMPTGEGAATPIGEVATSPKGAMASTRSESGPSRDPKRTLTSADVPLAAARAASDPAYTLEDLRGDPRILPVDSRPRPHGVIAPRNLRQLIDPGSGEIEIIRAWRDSLGAERKAVAWVLVDASGTVDEVRILRSTDSEELDAKAIQAVRNVSYSPPRRRGASVPAWTLQEIVFKLE